MLERMFGTGLFALIAFSFGLALSFVVLKLFKVKEPFDNKFFVVLLGVGMFMAYALRAYIRTS